MSPSKLYGLTYFGAAGFCYSSFTTLALHFGSTATTTGITAAVLAGMWSFNEKDIINTIEMVKDEGPHHGKLKFNISTGPLFTSRDVYAEVNDVQSLMSLGNDDQGEEDIDANVVQIDKHWVSTGNVVEK